MVFSEYMNFIKTGEHKSQRKFKWNLIIWRCHFLLCLFSILLFFRDYSKIQTTSSLESRNFVGYRVDRPDSHLCKDYKGGGGNQNLGGQSSSSLPIPFNFFWLHLCVFWSISLSKQGRDWKNSILLLAFLYFKLKVLKYPRNCKRHATFLKIGCIYI